MNPLRALRIVNLLEGLSLLALVLVAVPLKHLAHEPLAVRVVGPLHGLLFIWLLHTLFHAHLELGWPRRRALALLLLSALPFGFVLSDRDLR
jgi:integral membrane protein